MNIGAEDFILLLAKQDETEDGVLDTARVKAFLVLAGAAVEIYARTLHYAPCHVNAGDGFRVAVVLPRATNTAKPEIIPANDEDRLLFACNKWLLAHPDSAEAKQGAYKMDKSYTQEQFEDFLRATVEYISTPKK